jgi:uncharacterized OB-fold protein
MMATPVPAPPRNPENAAFLDAVRAGRLMIGRCRHCGAAYFYPRALCPFCFSADTGLEPAAGAGTIYACSVQRRVEAPYCVAYVTLDEGPTLLTNIVGADLAAIRVGQRVRLVFEAAEDGQPVPMFTPA